MNIVGDAGNTNNGSVVGLSGDGIGGINSAAGGSFNGGGTTMLMNYNGSSSSSNSLLKHEPQGLPCSFPMLQQPTGSSYGGGGTMNNNFNNMGMVYNNNSLLSAGVGLSSGANMAGGGR